ncbi:alpha-N-arabinofuranosidase [Endozoicomonas sp. OPT23]|uniref:alpha-N-arabinofuranosidase n=1 Tax=Endozoicomonas sp. OPT23 TaxID=2072845 RepID=UPI00129ABA75|nr:alpha-L-arabinofuranosidase C-terminal domain-containing protein [Endozoicomonas sp. OPT23]MRI33314.1 alpha-N-arabinofuranosidase [Endozoicomonas sp. OPT23]
MKTLRINESKKKSQINEDIYGQFAEHLGRCIYEGIYVGEDSEIPNKNGMRTDVVEALKEMGVPVLRWPGGCFADEYHWMEGVGPKAERTPMVNSLWGGLIENNHFGTHEFFELCEQLGCKTYINGNMGSGTVQEMQDWVQYMTDTSTSPMAELRRKNGREEPWRVNYFGIGNEMWGCGGNMLPEHYASEFRRYNNFVKDYDWMNFTSDTKIKRIASGPNRDDYKWTDTVMEGITRTDAGRSEFGDFASFLGGVPSGLALHYYAIPGDFTCRGDSVDFDEEEYYATVSKAAWMEELIVKHGAIMDKYDPEKNIGLMVDEWGTWYDALEGTNPLFLYQQSTIRDALVASLTFNIFNKHSDRVHMANIAQMVNVLQAMVLTEGDQMIKTPTFHAFKMFKGHHNATLIESALEGIKQISDEDEDHFVNEIFESVSQAEDGSYTVSLTNVALEDSQSLEIAFEAFKPESVEATILTGTVDAHNTFDEPEVVKTVEFTDFEITEKGLKLTMPATSVVCLIVK